MVKLFIGMPVFNEESFLAETIESIRAQTFTDWIMLISNNASTDGSRKLCLEYSRIDERIKYFEQDRNIGLVNNFDYLLNKADQEYFMWAAANDLWENNFLETSIDKLEADKRYGAAFSGIVNVDSYGRVVRHYPVFSKLSGLSGFSSIAYFVWNPEILGKANLIHSVFRLNVCKNAWNIGMKESYGFDMSFSLAVLAKSGIYIDKKVLFKKRLVREADSAHKIDFIDIIKPGRCIVPLGHYFTYLKVQLRAVRGTRYSAFVLLVMACRLPVVIRNYLADKIRF